MCSVELDPGELSSNGILGNRGLNLVGLLGPKSHIPGKKQLYSWITRYFKGRPR